METLKLNETPKRTSRNFNINNIKIDLKIIPEKIGKFSNVNIKPGNTQINEYSKKVDIKYGLGNIIQEQIEKEANQNIEIVTDSISKEETILEFMLDEENANLIDNIQIIAKENSKTTIIIKYLSTNAKTYHNGQINVVSQKNSETEIIIVNLINEQSYNFLSIQNKIEENAKLNYSIIDLGGKISITNYYSDIQGSNATNNINGIYLGKDEQLLDLNYIAELKRRKK